MAELPVSEWLKDRMVEELIDGQQAAVEHHHHQSCIEPAGFVGFYQHVGDGKMEQVDWEALPLAGAEEEPQLQANVESVRDLHDQIVDSIVGDVCSQDGANREATRQQVQEGVDAMVGLITVQPPAERIVREQRIAALWKMVDGQLSKMGEIECRLVGGVDLCLADMEGAIADGLQSQPLACPRCKFPCRGRPQQKGLSLAHVCRDCGHQWGGKTGVAGNPLAALLTPALVEEAMKRLPRQHNAITTAEEMLIAMD
jgi:hypothetical protein